MNFRFFGDSWFWSWCPPQESALESKFPLQSSTLNNFDRYNGALSIIRMLLSSIGHSVDNYCIPGAGLQNTRRNFNNRSNFPENANPEVNVIFVSSNLREFLHPDLPNTDMQYFFDLSSTDSFLEDYDRTVMSDILDMMKSTNRLNSTNIIVGGQQTIPKEIFNEALEKSTMEEKYKSTWHLLSENLLVDLACNYLGGPDNNPMDRKEFLTYSTQRFALLGNELKNVHEEDISVEVSDMLTESVERFSEFWKFPNHFYATLMWPDHGHMGYTGQVLFVDYLLKFLEDKNLL